MTSPPLIEVEDLRIDLDDGSRHVVAVEGVSFASIVARHSAWSIPAARVLRRSR